MAKYRGRVFRHRTNDGFAWMRHEVWDHPTLSLEAKGMLGWLMRQPPNRNIDVHQVEQETRIGRDKRRRLFKELEDAGYLQREAAYSHEKKRLVGWDFRFYDEVLPKDGSLPLSAVPMREDKE